MPEHPTPSEALDLDAITEDMRHLLRWAGKVSNDDGLGLPEALDRLDVAMPRLFAEVRRLQEQERRVRDVIESARWQSERADVPPAHRTACVAIAMDLDRALSGEGSDR